MNISFQPAGASTWVSLTAGMLCLVWVTGCARLPQPPVAAYRTVASTTSSSPIPDATSRPSKTNDAALASQPARTGCQAEAGKIEKACTSPETGLKYWLYLPVEQTGAQSQPPLLVYLHGFNHSGEDLNRLLSGGLPRQIENGRTLPMVVISPQCPSGENWQSAEMVERLSRLVSETARQYRADPRRVYLTGFSMGGDGVWALGIAHPEQFAALAPVGSWYENVADICRLKGVPVWDFQGGLDEIVSPQYAHKMVATLQGCGGEVKLTLYPGANHEGSSGLAFGSDELYAWLADQKRAEE